MRRERIMTDESRGPGPWTIGQPDPDPYPPAAQSPGHTKGPWQVRSMAFRHHASGRLETHYWIEAGTDRPIPLDTRLSPEARANALLLAASPDLLEALDPGGEVSGPDFLDWIADRLVNVHGENPNVDYVQSLRKRARKARAAIGKATDPDYPT
jgi:hypothetical protein